jgi:hypothetical protein
MAGAGQITAEAGGAVAFLTTLDEKGRYELSPYGQVCKRLRDVTLAHPDVGIACTPFAVVLDYYHGAYPGFGKRRAFWHFDYSAGDTMTWELINLIWPGGWEVMERSETGTMVNGPYGDTFDILLQNAPQEVLNSYPCVILSGDVRLSVEEVARYTDYVHRGGTLILNTAFLRHFPQYAKLPEGITRHVLNDGKGRAVVYGPDFQVGQLAPIIQEQLSKCLPVKVSPGVEYSVSLKRGAVYVTLINNDGVTKKPRSKPIIDSSKGHTISVSYQGHSRVESVMDIKNHRSCEIQSGTDVSITVRSGEVAILEFTLN